MSETDVLKRLDIRLQDTDRTLMVDALLEIRRLRELRPIDVNEIGGLLADCAAWITAQQDLYDIKAPHAKKLLARLDAALAVL